jgi:DNA polymerase III subunit epsilon
LEIGVVFVWPDGRVEHYSQLVNPASYVPAMITQLTGITAEMVAEQPPFEALAANLFARLTGALFIAHNARFDYGFLRAEFGLAGYRLRVPVVCTVKLARKLFPEWPRHNLDTIIERLQLQCQNRHRAWDDADLLYQFWQKIVAQLSLERVRACVDELLVEPKIPSHLPADLCDELVESSGVYYFYGANNSLLYIGKSRHIKQRVLEHFSLAERDAKEADLIRQTQRITFTETVGEWGALLREARLVKRLQPLFNRRLKSTEQVGVRLAAAKDAGVTLEIATAEQLMSDPTGEVYGFFKNHAQAKRALTEIIRAHQLCAVALGLERGNGGSCFAYQLKACKGACVGEEPAIKHSLRVKLALASLKVAAWPYAGAVAVVEKNWLGEREWHVFHQWCHLGSTQDGNELTDLARLEPMWDADIYYLIKKILIKLPPVSIGALPVIESSP